MRAEFIPARLTPLSVTDALWATKLAFERIEGRLPSAETLACLAAQSGLETGNWQKMYNYGPGGAKAGPNYDGCYTCFPCGENLKHDDGKKYEWKFHPNGTETCAALGISRRPVEYSVPPGHPQTRFRAWRDATSAFVAHLAMLKAKWPEAWAAALGGDVGGFIDGLVDGSRKYFTAPKGPYKATTVKRAKELLVTIAREPKLTSGPLTPISEPPTAPPLDRPTLRKGDRGPHVFDLQLALNARGMLLKVDGVFGPGTEAAVMVFQHDHHLTPDGVVGPATHKALDG